MKFILHVCICSSHFLHNAFIINAEGVGSTFPEASSDTYRYKLLLVAILQFGLHCNYLGHTGIVYALAILKAPGQTRLFSGSYDKSIRVRLCTFIITIFTQVVSRCGTWNS